MLFLFCWHAPYYTEAMFTLENLKDNTSGALERGLHHEHKSFPEQFDH